MSFFVRVAHTGPTTVNTVNQGRRHLCEYTHWLGMMIINGLRLHAMITSSSVMLWTLAIVLHVIGSCPSPRLFGSCEGREKSCCVWGVGQRLCECL